MIKETRFLQISLLTLLFSITMGRAAEQVKGKSQVHKESFGKTEDGKPVDLYSLTNANGLEVRAMNFGSEIVSIKVPDKAGHLDDVVLGYDNLEGYLKNPAYFGAVVGRYANRIAKGMFTLNGQTFNLAKNNGPNTLHGGLKGFNKQLWDGKEFKNDQGVGVEF